MEIVYLDPDILVCVKPARVLSTDEPGGVPELVRKVREKLEQQADRENKEIAFEGGTIVYNYDEDRLQILFDAVPDSDMRTKLKGNAFKWSPRNQAWQRQLTQNAVIAARRVLNITL